MRRTATNSMPLRKWTDEEIHGCVRGLESLRSGAGCAAALVGVGPRAVPLLRAFLLEGRPRSIFQPRQLAVETLAEIGAKEVLLEYLQNRPEMKDPVVRFGENVVLSTAARLLTKWRTEEVFQVLKQLSDEILLPGLVEALGAFGRAEMIPCFLRALCEDSSRDSAENALRRLGNEARPELIRAALTAFPNAEEETPTSLRRRTSALRILGEKGTSAREWQILKTLLADKDPEIGAVCGSIALRVGSDGEKLRAVDRMIEILPDLNWFLRTQVRSCLAEYGALALDPIEREITRRFAKSPDARFTDGVLRLLINLREQIRSPRAAEVI
jgi:HEAT repeat protein